MSEAPLSDIAPTNSVLFLVSYFLFLVSFFKANILNCLCFCFHKTVNWSNLSVHINGADTTLQNLVWTELDNGKIDCVFFSRARAFRINWRLFPVGIAAIVEAVGGATLKLLRVVHTPMNDRGRSLQNFVGNEVSF